MTNTKPERDVLLWAIDPFELDANPTPESVELFTDWAKERDARVLPVYVYDPKRAAEYGYTSSGQGIRRAVNLRVKCLHYYDAEPAEILVSGVQPRTDPVAALLRFAEEKGASAIALCSHGRSGVRRAFLGSFAESLLRESKLPVYFMKRRAPHPDALTARGGVLFPTDFTAASSASFEAFLRQAGAGQERLTIFHLVSCPIAYGAEPYMQVPSAFYEDQLEWAKEEGPKWVARAAEAGVQADFEVRTTNGYQYLGTAIRDEAKRLHPSLVVITTSCDPLGGALFGGASMDLFRCGEFPVLVYGPQACAEVHRKAPAPRISTREAVTPPSVPKADRPAM